MKLAHLPLRVATGAYILNSGMSKQGLEGQAAEGLHGMAVGAALLIPFVPSALVGAALAGFSAGLVQLYLKTPGMRQPGSLKPTQEGIGLAKDVWLVGAGLTLLLDGLPKRKG